MNKSYDKKMLIVFSTCLVAFTVLYLRISFIVADTSFAQTAASQSSYTLSLGETRGTIYDCRLAPLIGNTPSYKAAILPSPKNIIPLKNSKIKLPADYAQLTKPYIAISPLDSEEIPLVKYYNAPMRYAADQVAQHVIGYYDTTNNSGTVGIEKSYNDILTEHSQKSTVTFSVNGLGIPLEGVKPKAVLATPKANGVVLTIDKRIQKIAEEVGAKYLEKGAIVVMEPSTGKLKAVASFPNYNANDIAEALKNEDSPLINRAYSAYNVGSTFKLVTAAAALTKGISPATTFVCNGNVEINGVVFGCHKKSGHGNIDMVEAMAVSCNPYFINIAVKLSRSDILNMARDMGFGKPSDIGASSGTLPSENELVNIGDVANLAFGQGALTATPVQMAEAVAAILNKGDALKASIVEGTTLDGKTIQQAESTYPIKAMNKNVAALLKAMMVNAVMGTPNQNAVPQFTTAGGKTATAQTGQFVKDSRVVEGELSREVLQCWFAGFFPAENPEYVVAILSEDKTSGNEDASPAFAELADKLSLL